MATVSSSEARGGGEANEQARAHAAPSAATEASPPLTGKERRIERFLSRQTPDRKTQLRQQMAQACRDVMQEQAEHDNAHNWGAQGVDGLCKKLTHHSGSVAAAWRSVLDPDHTGSISHSTFCLKLSQIGFVGNVRKIWLELDKDEDGFVALADLDPEAAACIDEFHKRIVDAHGSTLHWWQHVTARTPGCTQFPRADFLKVCEALGYAEPARAEYLFKTLQFEIPYDMVTLTEVDPTAFSALKSGDPCAQSIAAGLGRSVPCMEKGEPKSNLEARAPKKVNASNNTSDGGKKGLGGIVKSSAARPNRATLWKQELSRVQRKSLALDRSDFMNRLPAAQDLEGLKKYLVARYGSMFDSWRDGFGCRDEKGRLNFVELCDLVRGMGFQGNVNTLLKDLDPEETGFVTLEQLFPACYREITSYKDMLRERWGNVAKAWLAALGPNELMAKVDEEDFVKHVGELGWGGDAKQLFRTLQREPRKKHLFFRDFDPDAFDALRRGDPEMISSELIMKSPSSMTFHERQGGTFPVRWRRHLATAQMQDLMEINKAQRDSDMATGDLAALRIDLARKYGTVTLAWKNVLDIDGNGRLSRTQFGEALRRVGFAGDLAALWRELDLDGVGHLTLHNFDADADEALNDFRRQLAERFGNLIEAWKVGLDVARAGRLDEASFVKRFEELQLVGNPAMLFMNLQAEQGRNFVTMADIDRPHLEAFYREDERCVTVKYPHTQPGIVTAVTSPTFFRSAAVSAEGPTQPASLARTRTSPAALSLPTSPIGQRLRAPPGEKPGDDGPGAGDSSDAPLTPTSMRSSSSTPALVTPASRVTTQPFSPTFSTLTEGFKDSRTPKPSLAASWNGELGVKFRTNVEDYFQGGKEKFKGCQNFDDWKRVLLKMHGSLVTAWRVAIDTEGKGRLGFNEFGVALRRTSYIGHRKELWMVLGCDESGFVTLRHLDEDGWLGLCHLRELLLSKFECLLDAWEALAGKKRWLTEDDLRSKLQELGYDPGRKHISKLFKNLRRLKCETHLYKEDLETVLIGTTKDERRIMWSGDW